MGCYCAGSDCECSPVNDLPKEQKKSDSQILGIRLNNPFNIRFSSANMWKGQTGQEKGFCKFDSLENGVRAGVKLLRNYLNSRTNTISKILNKYAPTSENDTNSYIQYVCGRMSKGAEDVLVLSDLYSLCSAIAKFESGYNLDKSLFEKVFKTI